MVTLAKLLDLPALKMSRDLAATIKAVTFLGAPVVAALAWLSVRLGVNSKVAIAVCAGAGVTILAVVITATWGRRYMNFDPYEILEHRSTETVESVGSHHRYVWVRELTIKSRQDGLRLIPSNWYWTGLTSTPLQYEALFPDQAVFSGAFPEEDQVIHRWIYLGRPIAKGEEVKTGIKLIFEDDVQKMRPFVLETPRHKTRLLDVILRFPKGEDPLTVKPIEWKSGYKHLGQPSEIADGSIERTIDTVSGFVEYKLRRVNPDVEVPVGMRWSK